MLTRRVALPIAALTALATCRVLAGAAPAGASERRRSPVLPGTATTVTPRALSAKKEEPVDNCPTKQWTVPLELKGLACILLLPKPEKPDDGGEGGGGGLGGLLG